MITVDVICVLVAVVSVIFCVVTTAVCKRLQRRNEEDGARVRDEAQASLANAQALIDQQLEEVRQESERIRQHYETQVLDAQKAAEARVSELTEQLKLLKKYEGLLEPEAEAARLLSEALAESTALRKEAKGLLGKAEAAAARQHADVASHVKDLSQQAEAMLKQANTDASRILRDAEEKAEHIAADAYIALRDKNAIEQALIAIRNTVKGYGDQYLVPGRSLLDDLAAEFGHTSAGESLRIAREQSRHMVQQGEAAACDYAENSRRDTAIRFVVDAFNGRVDAILARVKHDNFGNLQQEIRDAYEKVNLNGQAFRDARILPTYLDARLAELKWATVVQELRLKEREEQQRIREQMREEEKARREYERAMREAAMEEDMLRKAMEKAQLQIRQATAEQKAQYEQQLTQLAQKLKEAEERNQRAISMAQQTRRGHVYIISNVGSFGENIYKIGLTRRLEPQDRIDELGDSSVPFDFDVHALIYSEDAPALETKLHKHFVLAQVNKVNHRKEFFRVDIKTVRQEIQSLGLDPKWTMTAAAADYRETQAIEAKIKDNPAMREAWVKRQLEMEVLENDLPESDSRLGHIRPVFERADLGK